MACCTRGPISVTNSGGTAVSTLDFDLISGVTVRADGSGDAPTVQAGIDSIRARQIYLDVLWIEPGDYAEDVVIPRVPEPITSLAVADRRRRGFVL